MSPADVGLRGYANEQRSAKMTSPTAQAQSAQAQSAQAREETEEGPAAKDGEHPVFRLAGISYLHIPAADPRQSAAFYQAVFGWEIRGDPEHPSFTDGTGHVIGAWVTDRPASGDSGVLPYIYVDRVDGTLGKVTGNGGDVIRDPYPEGNLWVATFRDPAGNIIGVWQQGPRQQRGQSSAA